MAGGRSWSAGADLWPLKYPAAARKELAEGRVVGLACTSTTPGSAADAAIIRPSGSAAIDQAALLPS